MRFMLAPQLEECRKFNPKREYTHIKKMKKENSKNTLALLIKKKK